MGYEDWPYVRFLAGVGLDFGVGLVVGLAVGVGLGFGVGLAVGLGVGNATGTIGTVGGWMENGLAVAASGWRTGSGLEPNPRRTCDIR